MSVWVGGLIIGMIISWFVGYCAGGHIEASARDKEEREKNLRTRQMLEDFQARINTMVEELKKEVK